MFFFNRFFAIILSVLVFSLFIRNQSIASPGATTQSLINQNVSLLDFGMERLKHFIFGLNETIKSVDKDVVGLVVDYDKDKDLIYIQIIKDISIKNSDDATYKKECEESFSFIRKMLLVDTVQQGGRNHSLIADQFAKYDAAGNQVSTTAKSIDEMTHLRFVGSKKMCDAKMLVNDSTVVIQ